jgi:biopolymer transport protein ExbB/TolQ
MYPSKSPRKFSLHDLSIFILCCTILLIGLVSDAVAQERSGAWEKRAQRSRQQYEQYMEQQRDQIRAFIRKQRKEFQAMIERARRTGIPEETEGRWTELRRAVLLASA